MDYLPEFKKFVLFVRTGYIRTVRDVRGGHLETLQWAHATRCPWNDQTCAQAAYGGHLEDTQVGSS
jgi:hypothetical protein